MEEKFWPLEEQKVESSYQRRSQFIVTFYFLTVSLYETGKDNLSGELYEKYCYT